MAGTITEKRKEQLKEMQNQLMELNDSIQKIIDGELSMVQFAKKHGTTPQELNTVMNQGTPALLRKFKIANEDDILQLLRDSMSPAERLINAILNSAYEPIILDIAEEEILIDIMKKALTEREYTVISNRFGFDDNNPKSLNEIADINTTTPESIRRIEIKALKKLRQPKWLKSFIPNYELRIQAIREHEAIINADIKLTKQEEEIKNSKLAKNNKAINELLNMELYELKLSVRAYNCLRRGGFTTIGDLAKATIYDLMKVRNLGRKSLEEVINKLKEYGITIKNENDEFDRYHDICELHVYDIRRGLNSIGVYSVEHLSKIPTSKLLKVISRNKVQEIYITLEKQFGIKLIDDANIMQDVKSDIDFDTASIVEFNEYTTNLFKHDYWNDTSIDVLDLPVSINAMLTTAGVDTIYKLTKAALNLSTYVELDPEDLSIIRSCIIKRYGASMKIQ